MIHDQQCYDLQYLSSSVCGSGFELLPHTKKGLGSRSVDRAEFACSPFPCGVSPAIGLPPTGRAHRMPVLWVIGNLSVLPECQLGYTVGSSVPHRHNKQFRRWASGNEVQIRRVRLTAWLRPISLRNQIKSFTAQSNMCCTKVRYISVKCILTNYQLCLAWSLKPFTFSFSRKLSGYWHQMMGLLTYLTLFPQRL